MNLDDRIKELVLLNAVKFNGRANPGPVIGKLIGENPELKKDMKEIAKKVNEAVREINALGLEEQKKRIKELGIKEEKKEKKERDIFSGIEVEGKVTTAFPPEPSKYPHVGHAKAILVNYEFAKRHKGKFNIRFEDTNPELAKKEFYKIHLDGYKWLGIKADKVDYASDHIKDFYKLAKRLLKEGNAYICTCPQERMKENRMRGLTCDCRDKSELGFEDLAKAKPGEMVLRLRIDMKHKNSAMRDPTVMRIIEAEHPRVGKNYRLWPNYDFENAIMDSLSRITHRFRSKEFELRNELQRHIQKLLGFKETRIFEFARFNLEGVESSGRIIREKIEKGDLMGWDDPRLTTLVALRRRGFQPEPLRDFLLSTGITKAEATLTWDDLIAYNKRFLDANAKRYFFVEDPVEIRVNGAPKQRIKLRLHPERPELGFRELDTEEAFLIERKDFERLENNKVYRLMDCLNFEKKEDKLNFHSRDYETFKKNKTIIMHWLPVRGNIRISVLMPDGRRIGGVAEQGIGSAKEDEVVQFERFGFVRLDKKGEEPVFWFTHR